MLPGFSSAHDLPSKTFPLLCSLPI
jgi:hypothetical protein